MLNQTGIRRWMGAALLGVMLAATPLFAAEKPKSVIHVVTLKWKDGTTDAQKKKAMTALEAAARQYPGIKNLWLTAINVQNPPVCCKCEEGVKNIEDAFVMEFESAQSLKAYADSPAQKTFYEAYLPLRDQSRTHDIGN